MKILLICLLLTPVFATEFTPDMKITSDEMDCTQDQKTCTARGNARAEKLGIDETQVITADELVAHFEKNTDGVTKLVRLEALNSAKLLRGELIVHADRMDYDVNKREAEAFGEVTVTHNRNQATGDYGHVNLETKDYKLRRKDGPVNALLFKQDNQKKEKEKEEVDKKEQS